MEKLKVPTGKDFDALAKQIRGSLEEQVRKGMGRLNLATRKDVETVAKDVRKLREEIVKLQKAGASKSTKAAPKTNTKASASKKSTKKKT